MQWIGFGLPEHLARHRRGISFTEGQELQQIHNWIAFGPAEVRMRGLACLISNEEQQRGDGVGDRWTDAPKHVMPADIESIDFQDAAELGHVPGPYFEKEDTLRGRQMM